MSQLRLPELDTRSFDTLEAKQMLNDTIVEYYMIHRLKRLASSQAEKFHLFNTFFYKKLYETCRHKPRELKELSRTWDKNVKLFKKDYLIIPVCSHQHWFLVIICSPSMVPVDQDEPVCLSDKDDLIYQPCIIIFDSLRFRYMSKFTEPFRKFLQDRWEYERPSKRPRSFLDQYAFKCHFAKVPSQTNHYDCGIFMLHFYKVFIKSPLSCKHQIVVKQKNLDGNWRVDARYLRNEIKNIVFRSGQFIEISDLNDDTND